MGPDLPGIKGADIHLVASRYRKKAAVGPCCWHTAHIAILEAEYLDMLASIIMRVDEEL